MQCGIELFDYDQFNRLTKKYIDKYITAYDGVTLENQINKCLNKKYKHENKILFKHNKYFMLGMFIYVNFYVEREWIDIHRCRTNKMQIRCSVLLLFRNKPIKKFIYQVDDVFSFWAESIVTEYDNPPKKLQIFIDRYSEIISANIFLGKNKKYNIDSYSINMFKGMLFAYNYAKLFNDKIVNSLLHPICCPLFVNYKNYAEYINDNNSKTIKIKILPSYYVKYWSHIMTLVRNKNIIIKNKIKIIKLIYLLHSSINLIKHNYIINKLLFYY